MQELESNMRKRERRDGWGKRSFGEWVREEEEDARAFFAVMLAPFLIPVHTESDSKLKAG